MVRMEKLVRIVGGSKVRHDTHPFLNHILDYNFVSTNLRLVSFIDFHGTQTTLKRLPLSQEIVAALVIMEQWWQTIEKKILFYIRQAPQFRLC